jgi:hypothetical protein
MDFNRATSKLIDGVTLKELADEMGASYGVLRLSRLDPSNPGYTRPPRGWEEAVLKLARRRAAELARLVEQLERDESAAARRGAGKRAANGRAGSKRGSRALRRR